MQELIPDTAISHGGGQEMMHHHDRCKQIGAMTDNIVGSAKLGGRRQTQNRIGMGKSRIESPVNDTQQGQVGTKQGPHALESTDTIR
eukprot:scaffold4510_cov183-Amphora_coffeaeformis.AAC.96